MAKDLTVPKHYINYTPNTPGETSATSVEITDQWYLHEVRMYYDESPSVTYTIYLKILTKREKPYASLAEIVKQEMFWSGYVEKENTNYCLIGINTSSVYIMKSDSPFKLTIADTDFRDYVKPI